MDTKGYQCEQKLWEKMVAFIHCDQYSIFDRPVTYWVCALGQKKNIKKKWFQKMEWIDQVTPQIGQRHCFLQSA